jgi:PAS domain S-box-containing protein
MCGVYEMKNETYGHEKYPVLKLAQYLTGLTVHQEVWGEAGKALVTFFGADVVAFGDRRSDEVVCHHSSFSDHIVSWKWSDPITSEAISEVLESGFFSTRQFATPSPLSVAFLPIVHENLVTAVMLVGYRMSKPFPKDLLEVYLAVAGLIGTTTSRLASERELREHRLHLEGLVKKRTLELTETDLRFRIATEATGVGIWEWNVLTNQIRWDAQMFRIYGIAPTKDGFVQYSDWSEAVLPEDLPKQEEILHNTARHGGQSSRDFRIRRRENGEFRDIHAVETVRTNAQGQIEWVVGTNLDITERKQSENTRAALAAIVESTEDAVIGKHLDGMITSWNPGAEHLFGYRADEMIGQSITRIIPPELQNEETDFLDRLKQGQPITHFETERLAKDGRRIPISLTVSPIRDDSGVIIGASKIARDISERKQAETYRSMGQDILLVLSEYTNQKEAIKRVFDILKSATGVDAVGIRLQDEDDFPYFYQEGFSEDFLLKENSLLARTKDGGICRDECGNICLECTCGLVVTSKTDPSSPLFTKGGSSWTNDSFPFLRVPVDDDIRTNPRNECIHQGFASVALIPIRAKGRVVGLLQLNDRRKGCFTLEGIETLEKIAESIGESMLRKQAEEALRESEQRFRLALKNSPVSVATQDRNLVYQWAYNQKTRRPDEIIGKTDADLFAPEEVVWINEVKQRVLESGTDEHVAHWVTSNGQRVFLDFTYEPLRDSSGEIIGIGVAAVNLTNQKLAEQALQEREEQLRALADSIPNLAWWANGDGYITWYNRRWYEYTGTTPEQMEGWGWQSVHDPNELPKVLECWQASLATGEPFEMIFPLRGADSVFRPFLTRAIPMKDDAGRMLQWFGTNTDVSELEQLVAERTSELAASIDHLQSEIRERELAEKKLLEETAERLQATEALREKERMLIQQNRQAAMGDMISNISHQWRQPLNILGLQLQQLQLFYDMGKFNKELLEKNVAGSMGIIKHMSRTIDDFRNYFKPEVEKSEFKVQETINASLSLLEGNLKNPLIDVEVIVMDDPIIYGYPNEFVQVVLNIINNARDAFIERNVSKPKVNIKMCREDSCVVVTVADNAGGIPEDIINNVFDPYFTTKGPQQGTGIGLFMSKAIIENNMCGRITVRNAADGAEFRIEVSNGSPT